MKQVEYIRKSADAQRELLNQELSGVAEQLEQVQLAFAVRAGETGKLYGSVTTQMISDGIQEKIGVSILTNDKLKSSQSECWESIKPIYGLTVDLTPEVKIIVHREGESLESVEAEISGEAESAVEVENNTEALSGEDTAT